MFNEFFNLVFNNSSNEPEIPRTHEPVFERPWLIVRSLCTSV